MFTWKVQVRRGSSTRMKFGEEKTVDQAITSANGYLLLLCLELGTNRIDSIEIFVDKVS